MKISFSNDCRRPTTWQSSDKKIFKTRVFFFFKKHLDLYTSSIEERKNNFTYPKHKRNYFSFKKSTRFNG
jgi:hypothetical protein